MEKLSSPQVYHWSVQYVARQYVFDFRHSKFFLLAMNPKTKATMKTGHTLKTCSKSGLLSPGEIPSPTSIAYCSTGWLRSISIPTKWTTGYGFGKLKRQSKCRTYRFLSAFWRSWLQWGNINSPWVPISSQGKEWPFQIWRSIKPLKAKHWLVLGVEWKLPVWKHRPRITFGHALPFHLPRQSNQHGTGTQFCQPIQLQQNSKPPYVLGRYLKILQNDMDILFLNHQSNQHGTGTQFCQPIQLQQNSKSPYVLGRYFKILQNDMDILFLNHLPVFRPPIA